MNVNFLAILWFFTKKKLQNISGNNAANWWKKLIADSPSLNRLINVHLVVKNLLLAAPKILAVKAGTFINPACLPC